MNAPAPDPVACAGVIVIAMSTAGIAHAWWMRCRWSAALRVPLDAGLTWRGRRLLGDHKTVRGLVMLPLAAGAAFALLGAMRDALPSWLACGLWSWDAPALFALGVWAGFCFMAGELPNSFYKRRRGIAPGAVPTTGGARWLCLALDRIDSTAAMLLGLTLVAPLPWQTAVLVALFGPVVHLAFSAALFAIGVKARLA
ncbi:MAG: CDP-archaeol synthase [Betaproteobacteria bacterium]|nr:CDP-archaeol synthase [Betaproteobacteria bacterium]